MPQLIEHIDAIARKVGRDVLYLSFSTGKIRDRLAEQWEDHPARRMVTAWLDVNGYAWSPCGEVANENCLVPYLGSIYIATPFERANPDYLRLEAYLEYPDGSPRVANTRFFVLPLEVAMRNAHHDDPNFWEKWAARF